ncbi:hypothetical protein MaudMau93_004401 [Microsporum audouinii]
MPMSFWRQQKGVKTSNGPYYGLKVLVPRPGSSGPEPMVDIIFVHGLNGDCIETWKHGDAGVPWIMDKSFLGDDLYKRARIMTFGYNANVFKNVTTSRVIDHANKLLEDLCGRRINCKGRPIVFVAHNLGGLVVKKAMILCHDDDRYADIQSTTGGLIFMGTPHEGSSQVSLLGLIQNIASFVMMGQNKTALTLELQPYSASTMDINQSFMQNASRSLEIIVKKASAVINGNGARNIGMECNHQELCKFSNPEEGRFESTFRPQLEMVVDNAIRNKGQHISEQDREAELTLPHATLDRLVLLEDKDTNIRVATAAALGGQLSLSQATLDKLVLLLKDKSAGIREATARALGGQLTLPHATLDRLVLLLKDKYTTIRGATARALGGQSTLPQATLDGLVLLLKDKNADIRGAAARALGGQSTLPQATLDKLILLLHDTNFWGTRQAAAKALGSQLNLCQAALDRLILLLKDKDWRVRSTAADTLGRGFNLSQAALNGLILLLKDEYWESRVSAASALKEQPNLPQAALDALILLLKDKDQSVRKAVANAIGGQSNLPQAAFDGLILLLKDNDWGPRNAATNALKRQSNLPQATLDSHILLLKDEDWRRSYAAANVLEGQLNLPQAVLDQLILLFKGNDWQKRISAVNTLKRQSKLPQAMLDELILLLKDKSHEVWKLAFGILSKYEGLTIPPAYIAEPQLFMWWLEKSFAQQVSVYQQENTLFLNMLGKLNYAQLD